MSITAYVEGKLSAASKSIFKTLGNEEKRVVAEALAVTGNAKTVLTKELVSWVGRNWYWVASGAFVVGAVIGHVI